MGQTWPQKISRFQLKDPVLRYLASRYESEIPWQKEVKDERSLKKFVRRDLLPSFLKRLELSAVASKSRYFIAPEKVKVGNVLHNPNQYYLSDDESRRIQSLSAQESSERHLQRFLARRINHHKADAYQTWVRKVHRFWFRSDPGFAFLVIRGMVDGMGKNSLRTINEPDREILNWIFQRVLSEALSPNFNLSEEYRSLIAFWGCASSWLNNEGSGFKGTTETGWGYFPSVSESEFLSSACASSGWCIGNQTMAHHYLMNSCFFILFEERKPRVALRVSPENKVVECQGRCNRHPVNFEHDIVLFCTIMGLNLSHRTGEIQKSLDADPRKESSDWWKERSRFFPFVFSEAEKSIASQLKIDAANRFSDYKDFPVVGYRAVSNTREELERLISTFEVKPYQYLRGSDNLLSREQSSRIRESVCVGWLNLLKHEMVPLDKYKLIPEFVFEDGRVRKFLEKGVPAVIQGRLKNVRALAGDSFSMDQFIPATSNEPPSVASSRIASALLNDKMGILNDSIFPKSCREREDYQSVRLEGWREAFEIEPPLWFALPSEFRDLPEFQLERGRYRGRADLKYWLSIIRKRPWYLHQQRFPHSLLRRRDILFSYRDAWAIYLRLHPWRFRREGKSKDRKYHRNPIPSVFPSVGLLNDPKILEAMKEGWSLNPDLFRGASLKMKRIPAVQLSVLKAIRHMAKDSFGLCESWRGIVSAISRQREAKMTGSHFDDEIKGLCEELTKISREK